MKKRGLALLLSLMLVLSLCPAAAWAAAGEVEVEISVYLQGKLAFDINSDLMFRRTVTVTDVDADGTLTLNDALIAAHTAYYAEGASGYVVQSGNVMKLWGAQTSSCGFFRNDALTDGVTREPVQDGDRITAFTYYDTRYYSDRYTAFDKTSAVLAVGEEMKLTLTGSGYDEYWSLETKPVATAPLGVLNMETGAFSKPASMRGGNLFGSYYLPNPSTDLNGEVTFSFTEPGVYYVAPQYDSSNYSIYRNDGGTAPRYLVPAVCVVTVVSPDELAAQPVIDQIAAIGTVTKDSKTAIDAARSAYDALTDGQKAAVKNYQVLVDAEAALANILENEAAAQAVADQINAIGTVTRDSKAAIDAARSAYDALTDEQKALVPAETLKLLTDAEARYAALIAPITPVGPKPAQPETPAQPQEPEAPQAPAFADVPTGSWYESAVAAVCEKGLMTGTSAEHFSPMADTSRGMIVTILARMEGLDTAAGETWYSAGQAWAIQAGISDGTNMAGSITREQLAAMLYRYAQSKGLDVSAAAQLDAYADSASVSSWARSAMEWAVGAGLIQGSAGQLAPQGTAMRAETAVILARFAQLAQ